MSWPSPCIPRPRALSQKDIKRVTRGQDDKTVDYLKLILNARVYDAAIESPLTHAKLLSKKLDSTIFLKREDMQPVFSFKCRGAYNKMYHLTDAEKASGVIAVSAGNHAQGVALAAQKLGVRATICMPTLAPKIKVDSVRRLGAEVILCGDDFDAAKAQMLEIAAERKLTVIPPFDDPLVIAGQGTVGVEILRQVPQGRLDAIFVCVGGGGLVAGIAAYVKRIRPEIRIIGVNTVDSDGMIQALLNGAPVTIPRAGVFSDGTAVRRVGCETFRLCSELLDDMVQVTTDEICAAIKDAFEDTRSVVEPSGALAVAGCKRYLAAHPELRGGIFACVLSGANMNFDRLRFVAERARLGEGREALICISIPEHRGSFHALHEVVFPRNITEIAYRYAETTNAVLFMAFELGGESGDLAELLGDLKRGGFDAVDCADNELAKNHGRFILGRGRSASGIPGERVYRIAFPERPGALKDFLGHLEESWNVTCLHYRNHGSDVARVLVGVQVPEGTHHDTFRELLDKLGYTWADETDNPVYRISMK